MDQVYKTKSRLVGGEALYTCGRDEFTRMILKAAGVPNYDSVPLDLVSFEIRDKTYGGWQLRLKVRESSQEVTPDMFPPDDDKEKSSEDTP